MDDDVQHRRRGGRGGQHLPAHRGRLLRLLRLGLALFFASRGAGRLSWPLVASTARLVVVAAGGWIALRWAGGTPESLYVVIAASLAVMGVTLAAAVSMADWRPRG
ncbi:hypothetical protein HK414_15070 [Ramlibacter terrae]|uniref:Uncharacterized protein n=1 Tax=Ramlibacter terrae TaxID=2732511 RepID=A0ABX6P583_9BURK|nr:hypothetical protein HK414_15070 [Ramlibacter terrae]